MSCECFASISPGRGDESVPRGRAVAHMCPGARGKLPARGLAPPQCLGHFTEREIEDIVQQEGGAFERREPFQRQQQGYGQILGQFHAAVRSQCRGVENWFWQPGTDVLLPPRASGSQHIETNPRCRSHKKAPGSITLSRSAACQRKYVSCTASSASAIDPSMRYARPSRRRRYGSKLAAGFALRFRWAHACCTATSAGAGIRP